VRYEAYAEGDEGDARPTFERDGLMEPEAGEEGDDYIAECGGWEDKGEVGPGKRGEITCEEADEQSDADGDPWGEDGSDERDGMRERDCRQGVHAAREACVCERGADGDQGQDHVLARR